MKPWKYWLCRWILQLDRIPRYGRYYTWDRQSKQPLGPYWKYMRYGHWGLNLLDSIGWLHDYIDVQLAKSPWKFGRPWGYWKYEITKNKFWRTAHKAHVNTWYSRPKQYPKRFRVSTRRITFYAHPSTDRT